ncbi:MAG TPA: helix-turn-helix transcriptional regulator, partial [Streptomyces sp.]|uniref:helix-turn-helix domain-containing protein n=1 Tax=Streptomyces sp. TaxID=1931 RepID=UPI002D4E0DCB
MPTQEELFANVEALLEEEPQLPPPAERARLREAAGVTQARLAKALKTTPQTVKNWENGRSEPRSPRLEAYQRLLEGWAAKYPRPGTTPPVPAAASAPVPQTSTGPAREQAAPAAGAPAAEPAAPQPHRAAAPARLSGPSASRRPAAQRTAAPAVDPRFPHGPLAVLDGDGSAYGIDGIVLDCPATTVPELVEWTL